MKTKFLFIELISLLLNLIKSDCDFTSTSTMISLNCEEKEKDEICQRTFNLPENFQIDIIYNFGCKIDIANRKVNIASTTCKKGKKNSCFVNLINKNKLEKIQKSENNLLFLDNESNESKLTKNSICKGKQDCSNPACYC